jgi:predicted ATPase
MPLVGRTVEYAKLVELYHVVRDEGLRVALVEAEGGIGKTKLVSAFLRWVASRGGDFLGGHAVQSARRLPYHAITNALRPRLRRENAPEDLLGDVWLGELSGLLTELRERYPALRPPKAYASSGTRLFEAVARLGAALAERSPLVFFLDDIQWCEPARLDLLSYAAESWGSARAPIGAALPALTAGEPG